MAYQRMVSSGGTTFTLLGNITIATTSTQTLTLSNQISKYKYIMFGMNAFDGNGNYKASSTADAGTAIVLPNYFKSNSIYLYFTRGASGSGYFEHFTVTYSSDLAVKVTSSTTSSRNFYVYGVK